MEKMHITPSTFLAAAISGLILGAISSHLARKRGISPYVGFFAGFLFGLLGLFIILFASKKKAPAPIPETLLSIQGPIDKLWYYLDPANQQQGPMSRDALTTAWQEGKLTPATLVWHEDMTEWKPLKETLGAG